MKTIAVGPLELVESCVTGCTTVAICLEDRDNHCDVVFGAASCDALFATCGTKARADMVSNWQWLVVLC